MSTALAVRHATTEIKPDNPALLGFPPTLPMELAMHIAPVKDICEAYGIDKDEFFALADDPTFQAAFQQAKERLQKEGMSFRIKAQLQAELLLEKSWNLIHNDNTPTTVKADLIKSTVRWAGLEPKGDGPGGGVGSAFQININLG